jgi:hypothetical protein
MSFFKSRKPWATLARSSAIARRAIVTVGTGRGFVIECADDRLIITAAHCLGDSLLCHPLPDPKERIYKSLIGLLGNATPTKASKACAECRFADPISDIAVLGPPDILPGEADKYNDLLKTSVPFQISNLRRRSCTGWLLSRNNKWFRCKVEHNGGPLDICNPAEDIIAGMSGSPILTDKGSVIGVVCVGADAGTESGPNPRLTHNLPGWLLRELGI